MIKLRKIWRMLGPGLITGASDDEASGITTYTIAGAKFGLATLWMTLYTLPLMVSIQEMSGRIGRVSGSGLAGNMRKFYPRWMLVVIAIIIITVNTINIGADMSAMSESLALVMPFNKIMTAVLMTLIILITTVFLSYKKIFNIFKWLALSLFSYIFAAFTVHQDWSAIFYAVFIPKIIFSKDFFIIITAFLGTTIAPYLFFWQADQEVEERTIEQCKPGRICRLKPVNEEELEDLRLDTRVGMSFSNIITLFIIILASSTLFQAGIHNIDTIEQASSALKPLAGEYSTLLFTLGILGSGFLAIPILAGSAAYVVAEVFGWSQGLNKTFRKAKEFYGIIILSTVVGLLIPLLGLDPIKALFYTAVLYGIISPIVIYMIIHMANNKKVMGEYTNSPVLNLFGYITLVVMSIGAVLSLAFL